MSMVLIILIGKMLMEIEDIMSFSYKIAMENIFL